MEALYVFKKKVTSKDGKTSFDTYFVKTVSQGYNYSAVLTKEFQKSLLISGCQFPLKVELDITKNDYFITSERYKNADGIDLEKMVVVLQGFRKCEHYEIPQMTLAQLERKTMIEKSFDSGIDVNEDDVNF